MRTLTEPFLWKAKTSKQAKKENSKQNLLNLGRGMEVAVNSLRQPRARRTSRAIPSLFLLHTNTRKRKSLQLFSAGAQCLVLDNCLRGLTTVHSASPPLPVTPKAARCHTKLARAAACPVLLHKHTHDRQSMQKVKSRKEKKYKKSERRACGDRRSSFVCGTTLASTRGNQISKHEPHDFKAQKSKRKCASAPATLVNPPTPSASLRVGAGQQTDSEESLQGHHCGETGTHPTGRKTKPKILFFFSGASC